MPVSPQAMARLLGRLTAAMGKPFSDARIELQAVEYSRAMGGVPEFAVEWAVDTAIRDMDTYPKAAKLRQLAKRCPMLVTSGHDGSLWGQMQEWEADPWATIDTLENDRAACRSAPCPVCGSVIEFSDRGAVIVHDDQKHREASVSYSNLGKPAWFQMGPLPELPPRHQWKKMLAHPTAAEPQRLADTVAGALKKAGLQQAVMAPPPAPDWEAEQQARAESVA